MTANDPTNRGRAVRRLGIPAAVALAVETYPLIELTLWASRSSAPAPDIEAICAQHGTHLNSRWLRDPRCVVGGAMYYSGLALVIYVCFSSQGSFAKSCN